MQLIIIMHFCRNYFRLAMKQCQHSNKILPANE
nr:MAG TPA: hypothetical protein [Caudoviricetes sp.]